jgi:hypothetical protein
MPTGSASISLPPSICTNAPTSLSRVRVRS